MHCVRVALLLTDCVGALVSEFGDGGSLRLAILLTNFYLSTDLQERERGRWGRKGGREGGGGSC